MRRSLVALAGLIAMVGVAAAIGGCATGGSFYLDDRTPVGTPIAEALDADEPTDDVPAHTDE